MARPVHPTQARRPIRRRGGRRLQPGARFPRLGVEQRRRTMQVISETGAEVGRASGGTPSSRRTSRPGRPACCGRRTCSPGTGTRPRTSCRPRSPSCTSPGTACRSATPSTPTSRRILVNENNSAVAPGVEAPGAHHRAPARGGRPRRLRRGPLRAAVGARADAAPQGTGRRGAALLRGAERRPRPPTSSASPSAP